MGEFGKIKWAIKQLIPFIKDLLMNLLGLGPCGGFKCDPFGETPPPICLQNAKASILHDLCLYWGPSGMLYPEKPIYGPRKYKMFQLSMPAPLLPALEMAPPLRMPVRCRSLRRLQRPTPTAGEGHVPCSAADFL